MTNTEIIVKALEANGAKPEFIDAFIKAGCPLHTYATWKKLGKQVKRGEKAALAVYLWKYSGKPGKGISKPEAGKDQEETQQDGGHFFKKLSFLFWPSQLEGAKPAAMKAPVAGYLPAPAEA